MAGPTSPGTEGPTFAPPPLPPGWIAQWDGASRKYYFVQLSTGVSQWDTPTEAAPTGSTPAQPADHPYGTPQPEVITHPDGSQTVRHADGTMEPILPSDGSRGVDGPAGERGFGSMAMNALLSGGKQHGGQNSSPFALAGQLFGGSSHSGGHGGGAGGSNPAGKLVGSLVSSLVTPSNKPAQPQNYYGGQNSQQPQNTGGLAGAVMGGVAHMFGGKPAQQTQQSFGYSNSGNSGGYTGQAPPTSYQPPGSSAQYTAPAATAPSGTSSYQAPSSEPQAQYYQQQPPSQSQQQHGPSYGPPPGQPQQSTPYTNYPPPNPQHPLPSAYGQPGVQHGTSHPQNPHGGNHPGGHPPPHHQQAYAPQQQYAIPSTGAPTQPGFGGNAQYAAPQSNYNAPYSHSAGSAPPGTSYAGHPPYNSPPPPGASY